MKLLLSYEGHLLSCMKMHKLFTSLPASDSLSAKDPENYESSLRSL